MTNNNIEKILIPSNILSADDLSADEKKYLYQLLGDYGMTQSTAYLRLFTKGFDEWELRGIDDVKHAFCDRFSLNELRNTKEGFYSALGTNVGLKSALINQMVILGMEHRNTISKRFDADDWRDWERIGLRNIIQKHMK